MGKLTRIEALKLEAAEWAALALECISGERHIAMFEKYWLNAMETWRKVEHFNPEDIGQPDFRIGTISAERSYIQPCTDFGVVWLKQARLTELDNRPITKLSEYGMKADTIQFTALTALKDGLIIADARKPGND